MGRQSKKWLLLGLCVASLPALAVTRAGVQIGTPTISVVDLDPRDGIDAAYREGGPSGDAFVQLLGPAPVESFADGGARITRDDAGAIGGTTRGAGSSFLIVGDRYAPSFTFTVTPHSRVTVSVDYRLRAGVAGEPFSTDDDPAHALASFELSLVALRDLRFGADGEHYELIASETDQASLYALSGPSFDQRMRRSRGTLSLSFDNASAGDAVFAFRGQMVAFGVSPDGAAFASSAGVTPVPEPGSYALMLAGLGVVGWCARRRRQPSASDQMVRAQLQP